MNNKQLYESIMSAIAKEVKKALYENEKTYTNYHEVELDAIQYDKLPKNLKAIIDNEEYVYADKMTHKQLIDFIINIDWALLGNQYMKFYPNAYAFYEDYIYDKDISMSGGTLYVQVPCSDITLKVDVDFKWNYISYNPGNYLEPEEGGYGELSDYIITSIEIIIDDKETVKLTKNEIVSYGLTSLFEDEINTIVENMEQDDEYFN